MLKRQIVIYIALCYSLVDAVVDPDLFIVIDDDSLPLHVIDLSLEPEERFKEATLA